MCGIVRGILRLSLRPLCDLGPKTTQTKEIHADQHAPDYSLIAAPPLTTQPTAATYGHHPTTSCLAQASSQDPPWEGRSTLCCYSTSSPSPCPHWNPITPPEPYPETTPGTRNHRPSVFPQRPKFPEESVERFSVPGGLRRVRKVQTLSQTSGQNEEPPFFLAKKDASHAPPPGSNLGHSQALSPSDLPARLVALLALLLLADAAVLLVARLAGLQQVLLEAQLKPALNHLPTRIMDQTRQRRRGCSEKKGRVRWGGKKSRNLSILVWRPGEIDHLLFETKSSWALGPWRPRIFGLNRVC